MSTNTMEAPVAETTETPAEEKPKRGKPKLPNYFDGRDVESGTLTGVPDDYTFGSFAPLSKKDFNEELNFRNYRVWHHEQRKAKIDEDIAEEQAIIADLKLYDTEEKRQKASRARSSQKRLSAVLAECAAEGINIDSILQDLQKDVQSM